MDDFKIGDIVKEKDSWRIFKIIYIANKGEFNEYHGKLLNFKFPTRDGHMSNMWFGEFGLEKCDEEIYELLYG